MIGVYGPLSRGFGGFNPGWALCLCANLTLAPNVAMAQADSIAASSVESAGWLAGCWEATLPDGLTSFEEQWMAPRGGMMVGMSRTVRDDVARGYEPLTIHVGDDGRLVYHAEPSGQSPTDFPARSVEDGRLEFINTAHDFPQKIVYSRPGNDLIHGAVFGQATDTEPAFTIPYRRVKCSGA